jgi:hypothetical protein
VEAGVGFAVKGIYVQLGIRIADLIRHRHRDSRRLEAEQYVVINEFTPDPKSGPDEIGISAF